MVKLDIVRVIAQIGKAINSKERVFPLRKIKKVSFYLANVVIGIFGYYAYLYFWVLFSWGEQFQLRSLELIISLVLSAIVFLGLNYLLLRKETNTKQYWWIGLGLVILTVTIIVSVIELS